MSLLVIHFTAYSWWLGQVLDPRRMQSVMPFPFANRTATMDNSSDEDIASIVSVNNEFFYKHVIKESSGSDLDDDSDWMLDVTSVLHEDAKAQLPQWKGSFTRTPKQHYSESISGAASRF
jgi:hypothetical protein